MLGKACALNEKVEAARAHTKIEAVLAICYIPCHAPLVMGNFRYNFCLKTPTFPPGFTLLSRCRHCRVLFWLLRNWFPTGAVPNKTASKCDMTTGRNGLARTGPNLSRRLAKETPTKSLTETGHKGVNNCDALRIIGGLRIFGVRSMSPSGPGCVKTRFWLEGGAGSAKRISCSDRFYQSADSQNAHYPFDVVGQDV
jgi:hypothetical protein